MTFRNILHDETDLAENRLGLADDALAVLHGACRMVGDNELCSLLRGLKRQGGEIFADIFSDLCNPRGALGIGGIVPQHETVVLHRGAAA